MSDEGIFRSGGITPGFPTGLVLAYVHPDECIGKPGPQRQFVCQRGDHPTPTSGCTTETWITHKSEVEE